MVDYRLCPRAYRRSTCWGCRHNAMPGAGCATRQKRDRRGADRAGAARRCAVGWRRQARPYRTSRQAQIVEPGHVVGIEARRQQLGFPCRDRRLESLQLADHGVERVGPLAAIVGHQMLPAKQEAHEVPRAHGFDFLAQPLHRVAVNAREQRPFAPFLPRARRRKDTRHCDALRRQRGKRSVDLGRRNAHRSGDRGAGHGTEGFESGAHDFNQRRFAGPFPSRKFFRRVDGWRADRFDEDRMQLRQAFCRDPKLATHFNRRSAHRDSRSTPLSRKLGEKTPPLGVARGLGRRDEGEAKQRVVHFVGARRFRPGLLANTLDRCDIELPEGRRRSLVEPAPSHDGLGASLFQRRIVEIRVGPRGQNLERQRRWR